MQLVWFMGCFETIFFTKSSLLNFSLFLRHVFPGLKGLMRARVPESLDGKFTAYERGGRHWTLVFSAGS